MNSSKNIKHSSISEKKNTAQIFTSRNRALFFIFEETLLIFLIILQVFFILDFRVFQNKIIFFSNGILIQNLLWLIASIFFYIIIYVGVASRDLMVQKVHKELVIYIFSIFKQKVFGANRQIVVLVFAELTFALALAFSIYLYLDPEINFFPYPTNIIAFSIVVLYGYLVFSPTKSFRQKTYGRGKLQKKLFKEEGPHMLKRITKRKQKIIRVGSKIKK